MSTLNVFFDFSFWQAFISNAAATLVGVALGIPVALWISRYQERSSEKERKKKILKLLFDELLSNQAVLSGWSKSNDKVGESRLLSAFVKNESWRAFSDGGELQWIKDPQLLNIISDAYFRIRSVSQMSDKHYGMLMVNLENYSISTVNNVYHYLERSIDEATDAIDKALKEISSYTKTE